MNTFEIILIVGLCLAPVVAFVFVLPKNTKKKKKEVQQPKTESLKQEDKVESEVKQTQPKEEFSAFTDNNFKSYLDYKSKNISKAKRKENIPSYATEDYIPLKYRKKKIDKEKSLNEEINGLSPELKAMIFAGVLDRKDFD